MEHRYDIQETDEAEGRDTTWQGHRADGEVGSFQEDRCGAKAQNEDKQSSGQKTTKSWELVTLQWSSQALKSGCAQGVWVTEVLQQGPGRQGRSIVGGLG